MDRSACRRIDLSVRSWIYLSAWRGICRPTSASEHRKAPSGGGGWVSARGREGLSPRPLFHHLEGVQGDPLQLVAVALGPERVDREAHVPLRDRELFREGGDRPCPGPEGG